MNTDVTVLLAIIAIGALVLLIGFAFVLRRVDRQLAIADKHIAERGHLGGRGFSR